MRQATTIAAVILGLTVLVFVGQTDVATGQPNSIVVDGQTIAFPYTDSTEKECLHIYTDKASYTDGFSHAEMYLALVNNCGKDQEVELLGYFANTERRLNSIAVLSEQTVDRHQPVYEERCGTQPGTTTPACSQYQIATTTTQETKLVWQPINMLDRSAAERSKETAALDKAKAERKSVGGFLAEKKSTPFTLPDGAVVYYKVVVTFPPQQVTEMRIEAVGSEGGYGFLN